jgi:hypothetical protein
MCDGDNQYNSESWQVKLGRQICHDHTYRSDEILSVRQLQTCRRRESFSFYPTNMDRTYAKQTILKHKALVTIATAVYKYKCTVDNITVRVKWVLRLVLGNAPLF